MESSKLKNINIDLDKKKQELFENYIRLFSGKDASVKSDIFKIEWVNNA